MHTAKNKLKDFIAREGISLRSICNPVFITSLLFRYRYFHFFLTGVSGVFINLFVTWVLTEFVFGTERYFTAYLIAVSCNFIYNFILHTVLTFRTKERHIKRFLWFVLYSIGMTALQAWLVSVVTPIVGVEFYLLVIAGIILLFSTVSFIFFKLVLFLD